MSPQCEMLALKALVVLLCHFFLIALVSGDVPEEDLHPIVASIASQLEDQSAPFFVLARAQVQEGEADNFVDAFGPAAEATADEEGMIQYQLIQSVTDSNSFVLVEQFVDIPAMDFHEKQDYITTLLNAWEPLLADDYQIEVFVPKGGAGDFLPMLKL